MTTKSIIVRIKNVYGNELIYPVSREANLFAYIAGTKTLSPHDIERIKELGYEVKVEQGALAL